MFNASDFLQEMNRNIEARMPRAYGIRRDPKYDNALILYMGGHIFPVSCLAVFIDLHDGRTIVLTEDNITGYIIVDSYGKFPAKARFLIVDDQDIVQAASDMGNADGQIIVLSQYTDKKQLGINAVFHFNGEKVGSIALAADDSNLFHLWNFEAIRLKKRNNGYM